MCKAVDRKALYESLRLLKDNMQNNGEVIRGILDQIYSIIGESTECQSTAYLVERLEWTASKIRRVKSELTEDERYKLEAFILELEIFI